MMQTQSALSMFDSGRFDDVHGDEDWLEAERKEGAIDEMQIDLLRGESES